MSEPKKRKIVQSDSREIIAKVYRYLKKEYEETLARNPKDCDFSHLSNIRQRTAEATGSSVRTVTRILREERALSPRKKFASSRRSRPKQIQDPKGATASTNTDKYVAEVVRTIHDYIDTNDELDLKELNSVLKETLGYEETLAKLRRTIVDLGYDLKDVGEKTEVVNWVVIKEEQISDEHEDSEDVKPLVHRNVDTCNPGEAKNGDTAEEAEMIRIKSEPEADSVEVKPVAGIDVEIFGV